MSRKKLLRYEQNSTDPLIVQEGSSWYESCSGRWSEIFGNDNPIVLELACGKGHYSVGLGEREPNKNYVGIDIKGNRLRYGAQNAHEKGLTNVMFLRTHIQNLQNFFAPGEVQHIRIVHPDPRPKNADRKRRLTHSRFLTMYRALMNNQGKIALKTDDTDLFTYSLEQCVEHEMKITHLTFDLHDSDLITHHHGIVTDYEKDALLHDETIKYMVAEWS